LQIDKTLQCPKCSGNNFTAKFESTYVYSYKIEPLEIKADDPEAQNLPFLFDNREKKDSTQYIVCNDCKEKYPCDFTAIGSEHIDFTIIQKAFRSHNADNPEFFG
jgi:hypothetical protein